MKNADDILKQCAEILEKHGVTHCVVIFKDPDSADLRYYHAGDFMKNADYLQTVRQNILNRKAEWV